jgi:uncharacterized protein YjbJ (UPF0337 family)
VSPALHPRSHLERAILKKPRKPSFCFDIEPTKQKWCRNLISGNERYFQGEWIMNKDRVEGKVKDITGRVERQAGEWTGDAETQVQGAAKQAEGKVQNAWGQAKDATKKAADEAKAPKSPQRVPDDIDADETEKERRSRG